MNCERAILDDQEPETLEDKRFALEAARELIECYIPYQREMDGSPDSFRVLDE